MNTILEDNVLYYNEIMTLPSGSYVGFKKSNTDCDSSKWDGPEWDCHLQGMLDCQALGFDGLLDYRHMEDSRDIHYITRTLYYARLAVKYQGKPKVDFIHIFSLPFLAN